VALISNMKHLYILHGKHPQGCLLEVHWHLLM